MRKLRFQDLRQRLILSQKATIVIVNKESNIRLRHLLKLREVLNSELTGLIKIDSPLTLCFETNLIGQTTRIIAKIVITAMINSNDASRTGDQNGNQCYILVTPQGTMKHNLGKNTGLKSKEPVNGVLLTRNRPLLQRINPGINNIGFQLEIVPLRILARRIINQISLTPNNIRIIVLNDRIIKILQVVRFEGIIGVNEDGVFAISIGNTALASDRNTSIAKMVNMDVRIG